MTLLKATDGHDIAFAHGRMAVLQQFLLSKSDIDRLLGSHDAPEVARIFTELKFGSRIDQGIADPDAVLSAIAHWVRDEVFAMTPSGSTAAFDILWLEGDIPFLAYLLKQKRGLTSAVSQEPTPVFTSYDKEAWRDLVMHGRHWDDHHPPSAAAVVEEANAIKDPSPAVLDTLAAQWGAKQQLLVSKRVKSALIRQYVRHQIDLQNIRTALRSLDRPVEERRHLLLSGGTVHLNDLLGTAREIALAVELAELGYGVADAVRKEQDVQRLEQTLSEVTAGDIAAMWNVPLALEPLFAFAALSFSQLRLMRTVLLAKRAGFSPQQTKAVLPPFISAAHYAV